MQEAIINFIENSFFFNEKIKKMTAYWTGNIEIIDEKNILNIPKKAGEAISEHRGICLTLGGR